LSGIDYLKINGQLVTISSDGSFTSTITLSEGLNQITMEAKDFAGNITKQTTTITYSPETVIQLTIGNSVFTVNDETRTFDNKVGKEAPIWDTSGALHGRRQI